MSLHAYEVGQPYIPGRTRWPEAVQYNYRSGAHELLLFLGRLRSRDVQDVRRGPASFALAVEGPVILVLYRFGEAIPWSDAPFTVWMVPEGERTIPPPTGTSEAHALVSIILVDADSGLVRATRVVSWSPAFTAAIHLAIRDQLVAGWPGQAAYDLALADIYRRYPATRDLLAGAVARTEGGR